MSAAKSTKTKATEVVDEAVKEAKPVEEKAAASKGKTTKTAKEETKAVEKSTAKSETKAEKKAPAKRAAGTKKPEKQELKPEVVIQYQDNEITDEALVEKIKGLWVSQGHRAGMIKSLRIYAKPEEGKAYFVINDKNSGDVDLF